MEAEVQIAYRRCFDIWCCGFNWLQSGTKEIGRRDKHRKERIETRGLRQVLGHLGWQDNGFDRQDQVER